MARQIRPASGIPAGVRAALVLGLPMLGSISVVCIYLNKEILVAAAWVALGMAALVFVEPLIGIGAMTAMFVLVAYPTLLADLGFLTINNLLGLCLAVVFVGRIMTTRDLSVFRLRTVLLFVLIGAVFVISTLHVPVAFPTLRVSQGIGIKGNDLDRTAYMMHDFWVRLGYIVLFAFFVRGGRDVRAMFYVFALVLFLAVPSALINWWNGELSHGFRTEASLTAGSNPNRLAMICLMEIACWRCWAVARGGAVRAWIAVAAMGGALLVVLASGSRSGLLGCAVLGVLLQTGPRRYRFSALQVAMLAVAGVIAIAAVVPPEAWERALAFNAEDRHSGSTMSIVAREQTLETGIQMVRDHPLLGVGLGNFREVSRQIYFDPFFRPPHNSPMWAVTQGGVFAFAGYVFIFWFLWRDIQTASRLVDRDPACAWVTVATRHVFLLFSFFSLFADLWLNPITYVLIGTIICLRRHLERLPPVLAAGRPAPALARAA